MHSVSRNNGPTHAIVEPSGGDTKTIYTIEPENIKTMLHTNLSHYHRSRNKPNALDPVMGQGVFTSNGKAWAHSRSLVKAQFSTQRVRNVAKIEPYVQNVFKEVGNTGKDGWTEPLEVLLTFNRFTLDSATEFMFGTSAELHRVATREKRDVHCEQEEERTEGQIPARHDGLWQPLSTSSWIMLLSVSSSDVHGSLPMDSGFDLLATRSNPVPIITSAKPPPTPARLQSVPRKKEKKRQLLEMWIQKQWIRMIVDTALISELLGSFVPGQSCASKSGHATPCCWKGYDCRHFAMVLHPPRGSTHPIEFTRLQSNIIDHFGTESNTQPGP
ncbi:MAG: hypothetical protein Q9204_004944 [Flavoplaca sp. TL-2023a]